MSDTNDNSSEVVEVVAFVILVASVIIGYCYDTYPIFHKIDVFCPHASANMIFGIIVGAIVSAFHDLNEVFSFNPDLFFTYILPPIIFSAGYSLPKDHFFHNFGSVMMFAFVGTTVSAFFIGSCVFALAESGLNLDFTKSMMLGSLISAVDPVAVILVLRSLNIDEQLKIILFGESVLNDSAAVVINRVFVSIESDERSTENALSLAVLEIAGIALGSIAVGVVCALTLARIHKRSKLSFPSNPRATEMASFLLGAFLPYAISESLGLSGIMSVLFAGIISDYYTSHCLSPEVEAASRYMVQTLAYLGESFIFIYLGMSFFPAENHEFDAGLMFLTLFLCFIGRALSVFPLALVLNCGRKYKIPFKHQVVLWYSGLRGPVAYALAVATPEDGLYPRVDNLIISTTLFIVAFTTLFLGGACYPFIKCLKVEEMAKSDKNKDGIDMSKHWFTRLDNKYLKPYFGPKGRRMPHAVPTILGAEQQVDMDQEQEERMERIEKVDRVEMISVDANASVNDVNGASSSGQTNTVEEDETPVR